MHNGLSSGHGACECITGRALIARGHQIALDVRVAAPTLSQICGSRKDVHPNDAHAECSQLAANGTPDAARRACDDDMLAHRAWKSESARPAASEGPTGPKRRPDGTSPPKEPDDPGRPK